MEPESEEPQVSEMEELAAKAIRPSRMLSIEDLLASELAAAVLSEALGKIRHIIEALMLLTEEEWHGVGITDDEFGEAKKLYALTTAILNVHINREMISYSPPIMVDRYAKIPWPFPREKAAEWLGWLGDDFAALYFPHEDREHEEKLAGKLKELPHTEVVHAITSECEASMETYKGIVIRFTNYAMPKATLLMRRIVGLVSAESYLTALKIMRGKRGKQRV